jgi:ribosomal protein S6
MWQVTFASNPRVLSELDHALRVDEEVLRWVVLKRQAFSPLPNTFKVARLAEQLMKEQLASQKH